MDEKKIRELKTTFAEKMGHDITCSCGICIIPKMLINEIESIKSANIKEGIKKVK